MIGRMLVRGIVISLTLGVVACASAPHSELSIFEAMEAQQRMAPASCAAVNAATMCVGSSRFDRQCTCVDRSQLRAQQPVLSW